jgi:hypothetical protein
MPLAGELGAITAVVLDSLLTKIATVILTQLAQMYLGC